MEEKKDFYEFVMTVRKATTYIVDEDGNEHELAQLKDANEANESE